MAVPAGKFVIFYVRRFPLFYGVPRIAFPAIDIFLATAAVFDRRDEFSRFFLNFHLIHISVQFYTFTDLHDHFRPHTLPYIVTIFELPEAAEITSGLKITSSNRGEITEHLT